MDRSALAIGTEELLLRVIHYAAVAACFAGAALAVAWGHGVLHIVVAAVLGALGPAILGMCLRGEQPRPAELLQDAAVMAVLAVSVDPAFKIWQAPTTWGQLLTLNGIMASLSAMAYLSAQAGFLAAKGARCSGLASLLLLALPYAFGWLLTLQSPGLLGSLGRGVGLGLAAGPLAAQLLGRLTVLFLLNEFCAVSLNLLRRGQLPRDARLHGLLLLAAALAAGTPEIAALGTGPALAAWPLPLAAAGSILAVVLAQAGLWGQTYLFTGFLMDAMRGRVPTWYWGRSHFTSGFAKGAVYGGIYMALVQLLALLLALPGLKWAVSHQMLLGGALLGAAFFPLARTMVESFDGSAPFFPRLWRDLHAVDGYQRGVVVGLGVGLAFALGLQGASDEVRFQYGLLVGALAFAGVDVFRDAMDIRQGRRGRLQSWRVYAVNALLGGVVGGAIAWYLDTMQLGVIVDKFRQYAAVHWQAVGMQPKQYVVYPLFSKWGAMDLGRVVGGAGLLYCESLSGVVNWAIAAPLFGVNLVGLTALVTWSRKPLRELFSAQGLVGVFEQTIRVLRWGLWMAPVIYTFLRVAPEPSWYNQDGAFRTLVAIYKSATMDPQAFRVWSLGVFVGVLAYDWFRVLIWLDHMGLRVATLVNLSFVGGDVADEKTARFVGHSGKTRFIPEGLRRFATWAPLLIPFYLPRGGDWDFAWNTAETLHKAAGGSWVGPAMSAMGGIALAAMSAALVSGLRQQREQENGEPLPAEPMGPPADRLHVLGNGQYTLELSADGRGFSRVFSQPRQGHEIGLTRQPLGAQELRGKFQYLRDAETGEVWSLAYAPMRRVGPDYALTAVDRSTLRLTNTWAGIRARADIRVVQDRPAEQWTIELTNLDDRPRRLELVTYQEPSMGDSGWVARHPEYNAMHLGTCFVSALGAILGRNRLLKVDGKMSREVFFHAVAQGPGVRLLGYEDCRTSFIGTRTLRDPAGLGQAPRPCAEEGLLHTFDPCASLHLAVDIPARGSVTVRFADGYAVDEVQAVQSISQLLGQPAVDPQVVTRALQQRRDPRPGQGCGEMLGETATHAFRPDGRGGTEVVCCWRTPRPWAHIMANELGYGTIVGNEGEVFSFMANAQQNGLTPFGFDSVPCQQPGQAVYLMDVDSGETWSPSFAPLYRDSGDHQVVFGRGYVVLRSTGGPVEMDMTLFVPPDQPADVRILTIRNTGSEARTLRLLSYARWALAEHPQDSQGQLQVTADPVRRAVFAANPRNDFHKGVAFLAVSYAPEALETVDRRVVGGPQCDLSMPHMLANGQADASQPDDGYRAAAISGLLRIPAGGEVVVSIVMGQGADQAQAQSVAAAYQDVKAASLALEHTRVWWASRLSALRIETNEPAFDRLFNDWLPYQVLVARLWGRVGQVQRSGAFGFRDQLQDAMPLALLWPRMARKQILLHGGQQFWDGDVLQWWHQTWEDKTGIGVRNHASDPQLWLPYVTAQYVAATGDKSILDEPLAFLEGEPIPAGAEGHVFAPRPAQDSASLYEHCKRAVEFTLSRMSPRGLPLMGTGDWNDGLSKVGDKGKGESVWLGFMLYHVLASFAELAGSREGPAARDAYRAKGAALRTALEAMWRHDRYVRAVTDDGLELTFADALAASWPTISGAVDSARAREALLSGLRELEKDNLVLLLSPAFTEDSKPAVGRIADYPAGVRENGGQYSHGASWLVDALAQQAQAANASGDASAAETLLSRAVEVWWKISPIPHSTPEAMGHYGLPPHQQAADIYQGPGYEGRGGWAWYTGAAGRMLMAAYDILGLKPVDGRLQIPADLFEPKGRLRVRRLVHQGQEYVAPTADGGQRD